MHLLFDLRLPLWLRNKTATVSLLLCATLLTAFATHTCFARGPESILPGYGDMEWGDPVEPGMTRTEVHGEIYERHGESFVFGGARSSSIKYSFSDGRLSGVKIVMDGDTTTLLRELENQYGESERTRPIPGADKYRWKNDHTEMSLLITDELGGLGIEMSLIELSPIAQPK